MNLFSRKNIKNLLKKYQIRPSKWLGQNFLINREVTKKIIEASGIKPNDIVLEIGPGLGTITQELAKKAEKVISVEKDPKIIEILRETLKEFKNVEVIQGDIRKINTKYYIPNTRYKIVANLPFYLTAPVIRKFLELIEVQPQSMVLGVQKEVGQRICAKPPDMNILAVSVQVYSKTEIVSYVSKKSFWPQPKVDGAIIKITPTNLQRSDLCKLFFKILRAGFSQPRKQLINNLSKGLKLGKEDTKNWLLKNKIQPTQRAETLTIQNWINLAEHYKMKK